MSEGDNKCLSHMAYDTAFVARVREIGDGPVLFIGSDITVSAQIFDKLFRQFDFEWYGCP
jgi:hypothetical protein